MNEGISISGPWRFNLAVHLVHAAREIPPHPRCTPSHHDGHMHTINSSIIFRMYILEYIKVACDAACSPYLIRTRQGTESQAGVALMRPAH